MLPCSSEARGIFCITQRCDSLLISLNSSLYRHHRTFQLLSHSLIRLLLPLHQQPLHLLQQDLKVLRHIHQLNQHGLHRPNSNHNNNQHGLHKLLPSPLVLDHHKVLIKLNSLFLSYQYEIKYVYIRSTHINFLLSYVFYSNSHPLQFRLFFICLMIFWKFMSLEIRKIRLFQCTHYVRKCYILSFLFNSTLLSSKCQFIF